MKNPYLSNFNKFFNEIIYMQINFSGTRMVIQKIFFTQQCIMFESYQLPNY